MPPSANGKGKEAMDIENKMSGQPAPGRTHGRNIRFCGVRLVQNFKIFILRGNCGVICGVEPRRDEPRKIPRIRNRAGADAKSGEEFLRNFEFAPICSTSRATAVACRA